MRQAFRLAFAGCLITAVAASQAQQIRLKVGYTWSGQFTLRSGQTGHLEGPELGVEFPIYSVPGGGQLDFGASWLLGGKLRSGNDSDGDVFRFFLLGRERMPGTSAYVFGTGGIGHTRARGGEFDDVNGFVAAAGVGFYLNSRTVADKFSPAVEASYTFAAKGQLRGFQLGLSVGF